MSALTTRSGPIIPEATTAGETEHTRIPNGPRKSAIPDEIPRTAAIVSCDTGGALTLGRAVSEAAGGNGTRDSRRNVDDAATLLCKAGSKGSCVGVLAVDCVGDTGVNDECAADVDRQHGVERPYAVEELVAPGAGRRDSSAVHSAGQRALGQRSQSCGTGGCNGFRVRDVCPDVDCPFAERSRMRSALLFRKYVEEHSVASLLQDRSGGGGADSATASGDDKG